MEETGLEGQIGDILSINEGKSRSMDVHTILYVSCNGYVICDSNPGAK